MSFNNWQPHFSRSSLIGQLVIDKMAGLAEPAGRNAHHTMAWYGLISILEEAICIRIISKTSWTKKRLTGGPRILKNFREAPPVEACYLTACWDKMSNIPAGSWNQDEGAFCFARSWRQIQRSSTHFSWRSGAESKIAAGALCDIFDCWVRWERGQVEIWEFV